MRVYYLIEINILSIKPRAHLMCLLLARNRQMSWYHIAYMFISKHSLSKSNNVEKLRYFIQLSQKDKFQKSLKNIIILYHIIISHLIIFQRTLKLNRFVNKLRF